MKVENQTGQNVSIGDLVCDQAGAHMGFAMNAAQPGGMIELHVPAPMQSSRRSEVGATSDEVKRLMGLANRLGIPNGYRGQLMIGTSDEQLSYPLVLMLDKIATMAERAEAVFEKLRLALDKAERIDAPLLAELKTIVAESAPIYVGVDLGAVVTGVVTHQEIFGCDSCGSSMLANEKRCSSCGAIYP